MKNNTLEKIMIAVTAAILVVAVILAILLNFLELKT